MGLLARAALIFLLVFGLLPRYAFAASPVLSYDDMGILWGPQVIDAANELNGVAVSANSNLNAALVALGHDVLDPDLTHDVKAKLSNESTGGAFYAFAQLFECAFPVGGPQNFPSWGYTAGSSTTSMWGAFSTWVTALGEGNVWWAEYTDAQFASAGEDLEAVLNGGSVGGSGGSGSVDGTMINFKLVNEAVPLLEAKYQADVTGIALNVPSGWLESAKGGFEHIAMVLTFYPYVPADWYGIQALRWNGDETLADVVEYPLDAGGSDYAAVRLKPDTGNLTYRSGSFAGQSLGHTITNGFMIVDDGVGTPGFAGVNWVTLPYPNGTLFPATTYPVACAIGYFTDAGTASTPENNWPDNDEPDTPTPPNPDPPSNPRPGTPTLPKPTNPTQPVNVNVTVTTPVSDILDALNKIIQELENHCVHLQNKMVECAKYLGECLIQVRDGIIDAINESMEYDGTLHDDLMGYLEELFGWMRDNLNFDLTVSNSGKDDDIIDLLRLIYIQDGTGDINLRPVDITQDYDGYGFWTHLLIGETLPDLTDTNLAPVTSAFDNLDDKFPFSVPSDILRIFQSLDKPAQTPVITFTMPSVLGIPSYSYTVDLSPYDSAMQTVRTIELVGFVVFLLVWARRSLMTEAVGVDD